jgi:hypothetical protein
LTGLLSQLGLGVDRFRDYCTFGCGGPHIDYGLASHRDRVGNGFPLPAKSFQTFREIPLANTHQESEAGIALAFLDHRSVDRRRRPIVTGIAA